MLDHFWIKVLQIIQTNDGKFNSPIVKFFASHHIQNNMFKLYLPTYLLYLKSRYQVYQLIRQNVYKRKSKGIFPCLGNLKLNFVTNTHFWSKNAELTVNVLLKLKRRRYSYIMQTSTYIQIIKVGTRTSVEQISGYLLSNLSLMVK